MPEESQNGEVPSAAPAEQMGEEESGEEKQTECGVVMPISAISGRSEAHWDEVEEILFDSINRAGFEPSRVNESDEVAVIHQSIVQNLLDNELVVCDVSASNPNVMFELGLRLAFDKPTVIVKDDETEYRFDTSVIEHIEYPHDLRYSGVCSFKKELATKIRATARTAKEDDSYSPFLKQFNRQRLPPELDEEEVSSIEYIKSEISELRGTVLSAIHRREHEGIVRRLDPSLCEVIVEHVLPHLSTDPAQPDVDAIADEIESSLDELNPRGYRALAETGILRRGKLTPHGAEVVATLHKGYYLGLTASELATVVRI